MNAGRPKRTKIRVEIAGLTCFIITKKYYWTAWTVFWCWCDVILPWIQSYDRKLHFILCSDSRVCLTFQGNASAKKVNNILCENAH
jgi:hypothetical protein